MTVSTPANLPQVTIRVGATVHGHVSLQAIQVGSTAWSAIGPSVTLTSDSDGSQLTTSVASDGTFSIEIEGVTPGAYTIRATADGFQTAKRVGLTIGGAEITMPDVELKIGLVNPDTWVDGLDLSLVIGNFGYFTTDRTDTFDNFVDLNSDGAVITLDISPVIANIGMSGNQSW